MKRRSFSSLLLVPVLPATFLFVLTAQPARLYAESAVTVPCTSPGVTVCDGKSHGDPCTSAQGPAFCQPASCSGGDASRPLQCLFEPSCATPAQVEACSGATAGVACTAAGYDGACVTSSCPYADGGSRRITACVRNAKPSGGADDASVDETTSSSSGAAPARPPAPAASSSPSSASSSDGDGCSAAPGGASSAGSLAGLLLALGAVVRRARRKVPSR